MITFLTTFAPVWVVYLVLAMLITSAVNPFLYFIRYICFERSNYIVKNNRRPRIKDYWEKFMDNWGYAWWIPISDIYCFIYNILYIIFKPFSHLWSKFINAIKNIRI